MTRVLCTTQPNMQEDRLERSYACDDCEEESVAQVGWWDSNVGSQELSHGCVAHEEIGTVRDRLDNDFATCENGISLSTKL